MSIVSNICITNSSGNKMQEINNIKVIASKGIINDRYFKDNNDKDTQITLIESETKGQEAYYKGKQVPYLDYMGELAEREAITNGGKDVYRNASLGVFGGVSFDKNGNIIKS